MFIHRKRAYVSVMNVDLRENRHEQSDSIELSWLVGYRHILRADAFRIFYQRKACALQSRHHPAFPFFIQHVKCQIVPSPQSRVHFTKQAGNTSIPLTDYIAQKCPSLVGPKAYYSPTPYLFNGHLQTGYAAYYNGAGTKNDVCYER